MATATIDVDYDGAVNSNASDDDDVGGLLVSVNTAGNTYRTYFRFDLTSITAGSTINDTDLQFNCDGGGAEAGEGVTVKCYADNGGDTDPEGEAAATKYTNCAAAATTLAQIDCDTTGSKTGDLGATGDAAVAANLSTFLSLGLSSWLLDFGDTTGIESLEDALGDPATLTVDYTAPAGGLPVGQKAEHAPTTSFRRKRTIMEEPVNERILLDSLLPRKHDLPMLTAHKGWKDYDTPDMSPIRLPLEIPVGYKYITEYAPKVGRYKVQHENLKPNISIGPAPYVPPPVGFQWIADPMIPPLRYFYHDAQFIFTALLPLEIPVGQKYISDFWTIPPTYFRYEPEPNRVLTDYPAPLSQWITDWWINPPKYFRYEPEPNRVITDYPAPRSQWVTDWWINPPKYFRYEPEPNIVGVFYIPAPGQVDSVIEPNFRRIKRHLDYPNLVPRIPIPPPTSKTFDDWYWLPEKHRVHTFNINDRALLPFLAPLIIILFPPDAHAVYREAVVSAMVTTAPGLPPGFVVVEIVKPGEARAESTPDNGGVTTPSMNGGHARRNIP